MKNKLNTIFFGVLLSIFLSLTLVSAAQSFSATPDPVTDTILTSQAGISTITITNTGDESINLTITPSNLVNGANSFAMSATPTVTTNLAPLAQQTITLSYTAGTQTGAFVGSVYIENSDNLSMNQTIPVTVTVNAVIGNPSIDIKGISNTITMNMKEDDDDVLRSITLVNNGNVALTNIQLSFTDLNADSSSSDDIDNSDIDVSSNGFNLAINEERSITITIDPSNPDVDTYESTLTITSSEGLDEDFTLELIVGADYEIDFRYSSQDVDSNGILQILAEEGDTKSAEFRIVNEGDLDANEISFVLENDLREQFSNQVISKDLVTFLPQNIDIRDGDSKDIDIRVEVPSGQASGTYTATIKMVDINGDDVNSQDPARDSITLKVKVIGDIYIKSPIEFEDEVKPGDNLDVDITVVNNGAKIIRGVKITAILYDVDFGRSDITKSTSTFTLDGNTQKTQTIRFNIPEDAEDGSHDLEIRVTYDDQQLIELEQVTVNRPLYNIIIDSFAINPRVAKCDSQLFTYIKYRNLGKFDRDITVNSEILGTNIRQTSNTYELSVNQIDQQNFALDISSLEPGTYTVEHKIAFNGRFVKEESPLTVLECIDTIPGIDIDTDTDDFNQTQNQTDTVNIFGKEVSKPTIYLTSGLVFVIVLIVVSLFLL